MSPTRLRAAILLSLLALGASAAPADEPRAEPPAAPATPDPTPAPSPAPSPAPTPAPSPTPAAPTETPAAPAAAPAPAPATAPAPASALPAHKPYVPSASQAADLARALGVEQNLVDALALVRRHSVSVLNKRRDKQGNLVTAGVGSGVLVNKDNGKGVSLWVITNVHVTAGNDALDVVTSDGRTWRVSIEDQIERYDFALLRFADKPKGLKGVDIKAAASQGLGEGAWVLATGNPFFLALDGQPVCTLGCISGTDRILGGEYFYGNAIQHDAEVNPGNSGGPLWNAKGQLIGINGKIASRPGAPGAGPSNSGASFSIPIHQVSAFLDQMVKPADAQSGFLGVEAETSTNPDGNPMGAKVTGFQRGSPASAGDPKDHPLAAGDVIESIALGGKSFKILTAADLTNALVLYPSLTKVSIRYRRGTKALTWNGLLGGGG